jgi:hypothetical protein
MSVCLYVRIGLTIAAFVVVWILTTLGLTGFFHGTTQFWRIAAAFIMAAAFFASLQINIGMSPSILFLSCYLSLFISYYYNK